MNLPIFIRETSEERVSSFCSDGPLPLSTEDGDESVKIQEDMRSVTQVSEAV